MSHSYMDRQRQMQKAERQRMFRRIGGVGLIVLGLIELGLSLIFATAPSIYDNFAGSRSWPYVIFGLILIGLGVILFYRNLESD